MAKYSQIEWTHHTFNPWWGCAKVSPACQHCYAELWAKRMGKDVWGKKAPRRFFTDNHWREPLTWNKEAEAAGHRERVFCASMADVFEKRRELDAPRLRLWNLIEDTPWLDWLLLTKRPENVTKMVPWTDSWPSNVWLGATVENQDWALKRLPLLLSIPAAVRFLSCEPLLGPIDLSPWLNSTDFHRIDWVIAGGESGPKARPMHPDWATGLLEQCRDHDVPFHFKQWGHWVPTEIAGNQGNNKMIEFPTDRPVAMTRLPKKDAGRILSGSTWDGLPQILTQHETA